MKRFLIQITLFGLSVLFIYAIFTWLADSATPPLPQNDYMAAMMDKHQRVEEAGSPRMLIVGGSNIAFNIDSERVQNEFGLPVVNLGLNIGLGIRYITNEVEDLVEQGDIVLLFFTWYTTIDGTYPLMKHTAKHYPRSSKYYNFSLSEEFTIHTERTRNQIRNILSSLIIDRTIRRAPREVPILEGMYTTENFNRFGDFLGHHNETPPEDLDQRLDYVYRYWEGIRELNRFHKRMQEQGVPIYFFYPAYPTTEFEKNSDVLERFVADIESDLTIPQPIGHETFLFDEMYFFDTTFHLDKEGREMRTDLLIEGLRGYHPFLRSVSTAREQRE